MPPQHWSPCKSVFKFMESKASTLYFLYWAQCILFYTCCIHCYQYPHAILINTGTHNTMVGIRWQESIWVSTLGCSCSCSCGNFLRHTKTWWYPWEIQHLVSTYELPETGLGGGGCPDQLNPKCQDLSKSAFWGWWSRLTQPKVSKSVQICILGGGVVVVQTNSTQSVKICPNLHFFLGGVVQTNSTQSIKICPNLHFRVGGGGVVGSDQHSWNTWVGALKEFWTKNSLNWNV